MDPTTQQLIRDTQTLHDLVTEAVRDTRARLDELQVVALLALTARPVIAELAAAAPAETRDRVLRQLRALSANPDDPMAPGAGQLIALIEQRLPPAAR